MLYTADGFPYFETTDSGNIAGQSQTVANFCQPYIGNWKAPRQARVVARSQATIIADDGAWHPVTGYDLGTPFNASGMTYNAGVLTISTAGLYLCSATVEWPPVTSGPVRLYGCFYTATGGGALSSDYLYRGRADIVSAAAIANSQYQTYTAVIPFAVGDQVQVWLFADSASNVSITTYPTSFAVVALA